jgi:hypothetical protein
MTANESAVRDVDRLGEEHLGTDEAEDEDDVGGLDQDEHEECR